MHVGAYAMQRFGANYLSAQIAYSHFNNTTTRTITGVGTTEAAQGSFGSDQLGGRLEIGRSFDFGITAVTPFAAIQAARLWQGAYTEASTAGAAPGVLGLSYAAQSVTSLPTFLGAKFDGRVAFGNGMRATTSRPLTSRAPLLSPQGTETDHVRTVASVVGCALFVAALASSAS